MKAVVAAFNQEKALVGAFSVITNLRMELFEAAVASVPRPHLANLLPQVRHRSFTPRPPLPTRAPPSDLQLQETEERQPKEAAITFLDQEPEQEHLQETEPEVEVQVS